MVSNSQRALWTFLIYALVGPFLAALGVVIAVALAWAFNLSSVLPVEVPSHRARWARYLRLVGPAGRADGADPGRRRMAHRRLQLARRRMVAVIAFAIASVLLPLGLDHARPYLAFLAGVVAAMVRQVLVQIDIIVD